MDGSSDTPDDDETLETAIPQAEAFSAIYDTLLGLTDEELSSPVSASVDAWEDGTYLVTVFHHSAG